MAFTKGQRFLILSAAVVMTAIGLVWLRQPSRSLLTVPGRPDAPPAASTEPDRSSRSDFDWSDSSGAPTLDQLLAAISGAPVAERIGRWHDLQNRLLGAPVAESTAYTRAFLASGFTIPLNSGFVVGRDGSLLSAPDLRPLLLDTLDRINPGAAEIEARRILQSPDRPDDWAISLRIVASAVLPADTYLEDRTLALLNVTEWLGTPSVGFLQAFDASVYVDSLNVTGRLIEIAGSDYPRGTRFAARLALERKAISDYPSTAGLIVESDALPGDPRARAALLSRADIRNPADRQIVEEYLRDLSPDTEEGRAFAAIFPNYSQMVSDNLITKDRLVSIDERMRQDEATLVWVRQLQAGEDWRSVAPTLNRIEERITFYLSAPPHPAPTDGS